MSMLTVEARVLNALGPKVRNRPAGVAGKGIVPHALAKRLDRRIQEWRFYYGGFTPRQASLKVLIASPNPNFSSHAYLPGRIPIDGGWRKTFTDLFDLQVQKVCHGNQNLQLVYEEALSAVLEETETMRLPFLAAQRALAVFFDEHVEGGGQADLFTEEKRQSREAVIGQCEALWGRVKAKDVDQQFHELLKLALLSNDLGLGSTAFRTALRRGRLPDYLARLWSERISYYHDDFRALHDYLIDKERKIAYVMDNAGESVVDLVVVEHLLSQDHAVRIVTRGRPVLNDETQPELRAFVAAHKRPEELGRVNRVPIVTGSPVPGIDLTDMSEEARDALSWADLIILKGEGNFMGMPPENRFRKDVLYLFRAKNPLFVDGLGRHLRKGHDPVAGQGVVWFRSAA